MADLEVQTHKYLGDIVQDEFLADTFRRCINKLNEADFNESKETLMEHGERTMRSAVSKLSAVETEFALKEIMDRIAELDRAIAQKSFLESYKMVNGKTTTYSDFSADYLIPVIDDYGIPDLSGTPVEQSEKHLKKLIKHAKTPMERKMYEKQLNALYKKRKKKK